MICADRKAMKHLYREAVTIAAAVINDWDPYGLIAGGAPMDEFEDEASRIVAKAHGVHTPEALAIVVSEIFSASFEPETFSVEACLPVASRLFNELQIRGFLGEGPRRHESSVKESSMFYKASPNDYKPVLPGIELKTLVFGDTTLFSEFRMKGGSKLPSHCHVHEQTGYLVAGKIRLTIGDETFTVEPGDSWCIRSNVSHSAEILADSVAIEVFSPVREDYLPNR
jgi:quercetin dioxygenase-like cupin family protein